MSELGQFAMFLAVGAAALALFFGPIGTAVARLIGGESRPPGAAGAELAELRTRLEQLEADRGRMAELEERLDFMERVLAQSEQAVRLPGRLDQ
jgi:hypothetical protein